MRSRIGPGRAGRARSRSRPRTGRARARPVVPAVVRPPDHRPVGAADIIRIIIVTFRAEVVVPAVVRDAAAFVVQPGDFGLIRGSVLRFGRSGGFGILLLRGGELAVNVEIALKQQLGLVERIRKNRNPFDIAVARVHTGRIQKTAPAAGSLWQLKSVDQNKRRQLRQFARVVDDRDHRAGTHSFDRNHRHRAAARVNREPQVGRLDLHFVARKPRLDLAGHAGHAVGLALGGLLKRALSGGLQLLFKLLRLFGIVAEMLLQFRRELGQRHTDHCITAVFTQVADVDAARRNPFDGRILVDLPAGGPDVHDRFFPAARLLPGGFRLRHGSRRLFNGGLGIRSRRRLFGAQRQKTAQAPAQQQRQTMFHFRPPK